MHLPFAVDRFIAVLEDNYNHATTQAEKDQVVADACRLWAIWQPVSPASAAISQWINEHKKENR